jgi:hypothetical protein
MVVLGVAGCATPPSGLPSGTRGWIEVTGAVDLTAAYPLDLPPTRYSLVGDDGETTTLRREFTRLDDGTVELLERLDSTDEPVSRVVLSRLANGDVVIHEIVRLQDARIMRFEPPMLFAPAGLMPGETIEQSLHIETYGLTDPRRASVGKGSLTLTRAKDRANASEPDHPWAVLEARLTARVGPATIETVTVYLLEPASAAERGGLRERASTRTVRVLGIVIERERESLVGLSPRGDSPESTGSADTD